jgi:hypothetical protein
MVGELWAFQFGTDRKVRLLVEDTDPVPEARGTTGVHLNFVQLVQFVYLGKRGQIALKI